MDNKDSLIGQEIEGYQVDALLGQGGMGHVYRALDMRLNRYVALKVMTKPSTNADTYQKRFDREAQAIAKLKHPNIVAIYRFNEINQRYYMAMEYVDGADLRWLLRNYVNHGDLIDYDTLLKIMQQISDALDYAHSHDVIHRDIKPSNIMISREGDAILTDFGLALDVKEGSIGEIFGSPHYIAPEQAINSAQAEARTDFYGLGVILFEMLTGKVPFEAETALQVAMAHISDPLPDPQIINPNLHAAFLPVLQTILEKDPSDRYADGTSFMRALRAAVSQARKDKQLPDISGLGTPKQRIQKLPILPDPVVSSQTKPATKIAASAQDQYGTKAVAPLTGLNPKPRKSRTLQVILWIALFVVLLGAVLLSQYPDRLTELLNLPNSNPSSSDSQALNAYIEGEITALDFNQGTVLLTIHGVPIELQRGMPLYDVIEANDVVRIEGHYTETDGVLRFDRVDYAEHNGEVLDISDNQG